MNDQKAHYLHPTSFVFLLLARIRGYLIPAVLAVVAAAGGSRFFAIVLGISFVVAIVYDIVGLLTLKYFFAADDLVVRKGLLFRQQRSIPYSRIQNIDLLQNPLHRMMGVAEVRVETASGKEPEATLRVLSLADVDQLKQRLRGTASDDSVTDEVTDPAVERAPEPTTLLTIRPTELVKLGLISNRGMVLVGIAVGLLYEFELFERFDWSWAERAAKAAQQSSLTRQVLLGLLLVFAALAALRLLSVVWYLLRFYGYRLTIDQQGKNLRVHAGMFTKVTATIPKDRIQFISIHRTLPARWLRRASIRVETAGGSATADEDARTTLARRWFVPIVDEQTVTRLMGEIREGLDWDETRFQWRGLHRRAGRRLLRKALMISVAAAAVGLLVWRPYGFVMGLVALPLLIWHARRYAASLKYARFDQGVVFRSGVLTKKISVTFFDKIQVVRFSQSPFDQRWQMACLKIDTAAAGPAEHRVDVKLLDEQFARQEYEAVTRRASQVDW